MQDMLGRFRADKKLGVRIVPVFSLFCTCRSAEFLIIAKGNRAEQGISRLPGIEPCVLHHNWNVGLNYA